MKQHVEMMEHDGYAPHSHEVRADHAGVQAQWPPAHRYVIQIRTTEDPGVFRAFIDDAREAGVIAAYEDGSGTRLSVDEIEGKEAF